MTDLHPEIIAVVLRAYLVLDAEPQQDATDAQHCLRVIKRADTFAPSVHAMLKRVGGEHSDALAKKLGWPSASKLRHFVESGVLPAK